MSSVGDIELAKLEIDDITGQLEALNALYRNATDQDGASFLPSERKLRLERCKELVHKLSACCPDRGSHTIAIVSFYREIRVFVAMIVKNVLQPNIQGAGDMQQVIEDFMFRISQ